MATLGACPEMFFEVLELRGRQLPDRAERAELLVPVVVARIQSRRPHSFPVSRLPLPSSRPCERLKNPAGPLTLCNSYFSYWPKILWISQRTPAMCNRQYAP